MAAEPKVKYDRQLRIWGDQGQTALEKASVCLLNCGPTGSETLKNLELGGIGSITIVDGSKVEEGDLGNNFMVDLESVGQSKAKCVCAFLQELNDAVKAKFVEDSPETLIETQPSFFSHFTLVIATQMHSRMSKVKKTIVEALDLYMRMKIGSGHEGPDGLYYLDTVWTSSATLVSSSVSAEQWHYHLGHISPTKIR